MGLRRQARKAWPTGSGRAAGGRCGEAGCQPTGGWRPSRRVCTRWPGGVAVPIETILAATKMAELRAETLHAVLQTGLQVLEQNVEADRKSRLDAFRALRATAEATDPADPSAAMAVEEGGALSAHGDGGIDRDDPVLSWALLHRPAVSE